MKHWKIGIVLSISIAIFSACKKNSDNNSDPGNPSTNNTGYKIIPGTPLAIPLCRVKEIYLQGELTKAYFYDTDKRVVRKEEYNNGALYNYEKYFYTLQKFLDKVEFYQLESTSGEFKLYLTYYYNYDAFNRLLTIRKESADGGSDPNSDSISYSKKGQISIIFSMQTFPPYTVVPRDSFVIENGNVMSEWTYAGSGFRKSITYQYDNKTNPQYFLPNVNGEPESKNNEATVTYYKSDGSISNTQISSYSYNSNGFPIAGTLQINGSSLLQASINYDCQ
jgi:hypothetical protein